MGKQRASNKTQRVQERFEQDARQLAELARFYLPVKKLGGLPITWTDRATVAETLISQALSKRNQLANPFYSTSANGQVVVMCSEDSAVLEEFLLADQILPDGMPMVLLSKLKHNLPNVERVATTDLYHDVAERAQEVDASFYLLGSDEETNEAAVKRSIDLYPNLTVAGRRNGYFSLEEEEDIVAEINQLGPDFLWVGMGVPREQQFVSRNLSNLTNVGVIKTSGGLFDFLSLKRSRAPKWMQQIGLEWLYRTILEPRRLGTRYLQTNHKALLKLLVD
jgi:N-acetylglucosaminyldiphosphoundecaprenol N-acetyl-beta-D-mannosaminyltransferase